MLFNHLLYTPPPGVALPAANAIAATPALDIVDTIIHTPRFPFTLPYTIRREYGRVHNVIKSSWVIIIIVHCFHLLRTRLRDK